MKPFRLIGLVALLWTIAALPVDAQLSKEDVERINKLWREANEKHRQEELSRLLPKIAALDQDIQAHTLMFALNGMNLNYKDAVPIYEVLLNHKLQIVRT